MSPLWGALLLVQPGNLHITEEASTGGHGVRPVSTIAKPQVESTLETIGIAEFETPIWRRPTGRLTEKP